VYLISSKNVIDMRCTCCSWWWCYSRKKNWLTDWCTISHTFLLENRVSSSGAFVLHPPPRLKDKSSYKTTFSCLSFLYSLSWWFLWDVGLPPLSFRFERQACMHDWNNEWLALLPSFVSSSCSSLLSFTPLFLLHWFSCLIANKSWKNKKKKDRWDGGGRQESRSWENNQDKYSLYDLIMNMKQHKTLSERRWFSH